MLDKIIHSIENSSAMVISAVVVAIISFVLYRLTQRSLKLLADRGKLAVPVISTLRMLTRWVFIVVTLLLILQQIGLLQNVWATLLAIIATVAIGFVAEWSILSNIFSTLLILIYRPFTVGDSVNVPEAKVDGEVIDINFMYTSFKNQDDYIVQVPNRTFWFKPIIKKPGNKNRSLYEQLKSDIPAGE